MSDNRQKLSILGLLVNIPLEERIESLETAIKEINKDINTLTLQFEKIIKFMEAYINGDKPKP